MHYSRSQIVITGAGLITALGLSRRQTWDAVVRGKCGAGPLPAMESPLPPGADGGQAPELPENFEPALPREARYLRHALLQALHDAGIPGSFPHPSERRGLLMGTTLHGMRSAGRFFRTGRHAELKDFLAGSVLRNATAGMHFAGASTTTCSACSSSLGSVALAFTLLQSGQLDLVVAGGYDAVSEYVYGGFNSLRLVAPGHLLPFSRGREGMKLSEGYGVVVLERADDARARGVKPIAAVLGYGESADAHHLTQPHPEGEGAARAMTEALTDAGLTPADVDLIAAHATGTPDNDASEYAALSRVFGNRLPEIPVVALKSHLGHTLGGAGAVELILSAMALRDQVVPACANVEREQVEFADLKLATGDSRRAAIRHTLNTSLGFGGANTCVVLGPVEEPRTRPATFVRPESRLDRDVFITGVGTVFPGAIGNDALLRLSSQPLVANRQDTGAIAESEFLSLLNARRVRRMSEYVKLSLAATMLCLRDAGVEAVEDFARSCAVILGTAHGSTNYCESYYRKIVEEGVSGANPMLFAEGVPNAAAAHLSLMLGLKGPCQTVIGSRTAGLDALRLAWNRIAAGRWDRAIVGAAEEYSPQVNAAYAQWGAYGKCGFRTGAGAVTLLLESRRSMDSHGGRPLGRVLNAAGAAARGGGIARLVREIDRKLGRPDVVLSSANGTWIDRVEAAGLRTRSTRTVLRPKGIAECFSVTPMAGIAQQLLGANDTISGVSRFGVVAIDYSGAAGGILIDPMPNGLAREPSGL